MDSAIKSSIKNDFQRHDKDSGSAEVQVALLTRRITDLSDHFKTHAKDFSSRRGLLRMVSRRRRLLDYLKQTDSPGYQKLVQKLGLRH